MSDITFKPKSRREHLKDYRVTSLYRKRVILECTHVQKRSEGGKRIYVYVFDWMFDKTYKLTFFSNSKEIRCNRLCAKLFFFVNGFGLMW